MGDPRGDLEIFRRSAFILSFSVFRLLFVFFFLLLMPPCFFTEVFQTLSAQPQS